MLHGDATLAFLPKPVAAVALLMRYSNCREEDAVILRGLDLRMDNEVRGY